MKTKWLFLSVLVLTSFSWAETTEPETSVVGHSKGPAYTKAGKETVMRACKDQLTDRVNLLLSTCEGLEDGIGAVTGERNCLRHGMTLLKGGNLFKYVGTFIHHLCKRAPERQKYRCFRNAIRTSGHRMLREIRSECMEESTNRRRAWCMEQRTAPRH